MSWTCAYLVEGGCKRLKRKCKPGMKGCVLDNKAKFIDLNEDVKPKKKKRKGQ